MLDHKRKVMKSTTLFTAKKKKKKGKHTVIKEQQGTYLVVWYPRKLN